MEDVKEAAPDSPWRKMLTDIEAEIVKTKQRLRDLSLSAQIIREKIRLGEEFSESWLAKARGRIASGKGQ